MAPVYLSKIELLICILLFYKVLRDKIRWLKLLQVIFKSGKYQNLLKGIENLEELYTNQPCLEYVWLRYPGPPR